MTLFKIWVKIRQYLKDSSDELLENCGRNSIPCPIAESVETEDERCFEEDDTPDEVEEPPPMAKKMALLA